MTAVAGGPLFGRMFSNTAMETAASNLALGIVGTAKDKDTGNIQEELSKAANLALAMNATMTAWENAVTGYNEMLFSGTEDAIGNLTEIIADGALIPGGVAKGSFAPKVLTAVTMKDLAKRALFLYLIPEAWKNNEDANVAVLSTGRDCDDFREYENEHVPIDLAKKVQFCHPDTDKQYLLLAAIGDSVECPPTPPYGQPPYCPHRDWSAPPGLDKVGDFGISVQDLMKASIKTWEKNGKKNGGEFDSGGLGIKHFYDMSKGEEENKDKMLDLGMVSLPVCSISDALKKWGYPKGDHFPC